MLDNIYMQVLDMSKTASIVILVVVLARLLLKKAPKVFSYALWAVVLFRLLCPVTFEAPVSIVPEMNSVSQGYTLSEESISVFGAGEAAYQAVGDALNGGLGIQHIRTTEKTETGMTKYVTTDWWSVWILFGQYVWVAGITAMLIYSAVSYLKLRKKLSVVVPLRDNIFIADDIKSPFVVGLFRPKIYLPCNLGDKEQEYIILHEQHHIKRLDHVMKALAFLALAIHWFNPLVWVAFVLASKDMEMSCDEAVIRKVDGDVRADYSASLLTLATGRRIIAGTPLAFGEGDTKGRINNLSKWKKPAVWVVLIAVVACAVLAVTVLTNPITMGDHFVLTNTDSPANTNKLSYDIQLGNKAMSGQIYVEQWIDGACVKSAPVVMTQYVDSIEITMRDRREDGTSVGTDIQIETNQYGGSLLTYFEHPENFNVIGWGFKGYELNEKNKLTSSEEVILAAKVFDNGSGIRAYDCNTLVNEPERIKDAAYMIVVRAVFSEDPLGVTSHSEASFPTEVLTLNDVIILSQKGYDLTWADFENYDYIETGSGLYIRVYEINARFRLMIGGGGPDSDPMYIYLALANDLDTRIDIRDGGVTEFISEYGNLAPAYHPEGILHLGLNAEIVEIDASNHILYVKDIDESVDVFGDRCAIDCNYAISRFNLLYVNYGDANDVRTIGFNDFQMGDAVIIGLYDSEKQKALNGAAVAEQVQLGTQKFTDENLIKKIAKDLDLPADCRLSYIGEYSDSSYALLWFAIDGNYPDRYVAVECEKQSSGKYKFIDSFSPMIYALDIVHVVWKAEDIFLVNNRDCAKIIYMNQAEEIVKTTDLAEQGLPYIFRLSMPTNPGICMFVDADGEEIR